jgi:hypothetical protein
VEVTAACSRGKRVFPLAFTLLREWTTVPEGRILTDFSIPSTSTHSASQAIFDQANKSWCGAGCGLCFQLTSTGKSPCSTCGTGGASGQSIIVMVTNLCPNNGNAQWCPAVGGTNQYGYSAHFDIMSNGNFLWGECAVHDSQHPK